MVLSLFCLPLAKGVGGAGRSNIRVVLQGLLQQFPTTLISAGPRFEPWCAHRPVAGCKLSQAFSQLLRGNGGFLASHTSLKPSLLGDEPAFAGLSLRRKFPFPARGGDRFDDWVVGHQFEPNYLHHPVFVNRRFPTRRQTGRFCGDFRPLNFRLLVSASVGAFW
jgi:hypothetical protein